MWSWRVAIIYIASFERINKINMAAIIVNLTFNRFHYKYVLVFSNI